MTVYHILVFLWNFEFSHSHFSYRSKKLEEWAIYVVFTIEEAPCNLWDGGETGVGTSAEVIADGSRERTT
jgi:hypothetical protein